MSKVTIQIKSLQMMNRTLILNVKVTDLGNYSDDEYEKYYSAGDEYGMTVEENGS